MGELRSVQDFYRNESGAGLFLPMSFTHVAIVFADAYYGQGDKAKLLVALAIAECARGEDGRAWPSVEYIARKARTSIRGVQEACRELETAGRLEVSIGNGPHGTNVYTVLTPRNGCTPPAMAAPRNGAAEIPAPDCTQTIRNQKEPSVKKEKKVGSARGLEFADWFKTTLPESHKLPADWRNNFACCFDDMIRLDGRTETQIAAVCKWARSDSFWSANFLSPRKLRDKKHGVQYFDSLTEKMKADKPRSGSKVEAVNPRTYTEQAL